MIYSFNFDEITMCKGCPFVEIPEDTIGGMFDEHQCDCRLLPYQGSLYPLNMYEKPSQCPIYNCDHPSEPIMAKFMRAVELAKIIYIAPDGSVGGDLHIILDDGNIDNNAIRFCWKHANETPFMSGEWLSAEKELLQLLASMTLAERIAVVSAIYGWKEELTDANQERFIPFKLEN